jgi:hypothetical protein
MDLDAGEESGNMGDQSGEKGQFSIVEPVGEAMEQESVEARITDNDFQPISGGRIALEDDLKVGLQGIEPSCPSIGFNSLMPFLTFFKGDGL